MEVVMMKNIFIIFFFVDLQHHHDTGVGISIIDRFTYYTLDFFESSMKSDSLKTIKEWVCIKKIGFGVFINGNEIVL